MKTYSRLLSAAIVIGAVRVKVCPLMYKHIDSTFGIAEDLLKITAHEIEGQGALL